MSITYMAKFHHELPGNSYNLKLVFTDNNGKQLPDSSLRQICAGILKHTLELSAFYCPNINSYKRLFEPDIHQNWNKLGDNNNLKGINLIQEDGITKISFALPGADSNPYLILMSIIKSAQNGLENKLDVSNIEKELDSKSLPMTLLQGVKHFEKSAFAKQILGEEYHDHYCNFYTYEFKQYMNQISNWEMERYLYAI